MTDSKIKEVTEKKMSERQKRIEAIREAVTHDSANLEPAYADRAWLLSELDAVQHHRASLQRAAQGPLVTGLGIDTEGACRAVLDDQIADGSLWALAEVHPAAIVRVLIRMLQEKILALSEEQQRRKDTENALRRYHTALDDLIEDLCWRQLDGENFNPGLVALIDKACDVLLEPAPGMLAAARAMAEYRRMKATK